MAKEDNNATIPIDNDLTDNPGSSDHQDDDQTILNAANNQDGANKEEEAAPKADHLEEQNDQEEETTPDNDETKTEELVDESSGEIHYTLEKVSEDIDLFLETLPSHSKDGTIKEEDSGAEEEHVEDSLLEVPDFVDTFLDLAEAKIINYDSTCEVRAKWCQDPEADKSLLETVGRISKLSISFGKCKLDGKDGNLFNRINSMQQRAMSFLEDQFRFLLEDHKPTIVGSNPGNDTKGKHDSDSKKSNEDSEKGAASSETESNEEMDFPGYSEEVVTNMNLIVKEMISGGFEEECSQIYAISRRSAFEEIMVKLGFERFSFDELQKMQWDALEREISNWNHTFKQCASIFFSGEKMLAETVFSDYPSNSGNLLSKLIGSILIHLLNFVEAIAMAKRSTEKLFKMLDMYETLHISIPKLDGLFTEEHEREFKAETASSRNRLGQSAICMFCDLENSIKSDTGKVPVPGGAVHPLTRYVMNYLEYACDYKDTLELVFKEHFKVERADSTSRPCLEGDQSQHQNKNSPENQSPLPIQLMKIMELLDTSLDAKSKLYKDISLSNIFLMNNGRYILQKIKGSKEFNTMMGDQWVRRRSSDLRTYHKNYQRETWSKLLNVITNHDGLMSRGKIVKPNLKERFKSFNAMFEEIHKTQSQWVVKDEQLQSELRVSVSAVMIPAYRSFFGRFSQFLDPGRQTEKYVKFQPDDIETYIDELFDGTSTTTPKRK